MYFMRVSQRSMYGQMLTSMNQTLSDLMNSNIQSATEKRINRPSDDPAGMSRVLNYRSSLNNIGQYQKNVQTAEGWLKTADGILSTQVSTLITRFTELAQMGANGVFQSENREEISFEMRHIYEQMIQLANAKYEGQHIFAGQKTDQPAFVQGLNVTCNDKTFATDDVDFEVQGGSASTIVVQFLDDGPLAAGMAVRYSDDGGKTWKDGTVQPPGIDSTTISLGGVDVIVHHPSGVPSVTAVDPENKNETNNGTWMYVRPTAIYQGDDEDAIDVNTYDGNVGTATGEAQGYFPNDIVVRVDTPGPPHIYSYSIDGGGSWVTGNEVNSDRLLIPGGFLDITGAPVAGDQFVVHPRRAHIKLEISADEYININNIGKDVFGGIYKSPSDDYPKTVYGDDDSRNLFEVLGRAIAYAETNSQDGCQRALEELKIADSMILTHAANLGGRENRLSACATMLDSMELTETQTLSNVEDVDFSKLMIQLSQQQLAYQSVLKSSSMIMQMSLLNYI